MAKTHTNISGYAVPLEFNRNIDHTYVLSAAGYVWGCWGRSAGGRLLTSKEGDAAVANCLASENGEADIVYGLTGVCHQTANRILFASRQTVGNARGYMASVFAFGIYGIGRWPRKNTCLGEDSALPSGFAPDIQQEHEQMSSDDDIAFEQSGLPEQFFELVEQRSVVLNKSEKAEIFKIQKTMYDNRSRMWSFTADPDRFRVYFETENLKCLRLVEKIIGIARFKSIYDGTPDEVYKLLDPVEFKRSRC